MLDADSKEYSSGSTAIFNPLVTTTYKATIKGSATYCSNTVVVSSSSTQTVGTNSQSGVVLGASTFNFKRDLRFGSKLSPDVLELQKILVAKGFLAADGATGYFGQMTFAAVKKYQQANGIDPTGFVGPATRAKLNGGTTPIATVPATPSVQGASTFQFSRDMQLGSKLSPDVLELQKVLVARTLLTSDNATGYFGQMTLSAVKNYQALVNINPTGYVGPATRAKLNAGL